MNRLVQQDTGMCQLWRASMLRIRTLHPHLDRKAVEALVMRDCLHHIQQDPALQRKVRGCSSLPEAFVLEGRKKVELRFKRITDLVLTGCVETGQMPL